MNSITINGAWDFKSKSDNQLYFRPFRGANKMTRDNCKDDHKLHKSLDEISKDIKELEDFITVTEDILRKERELDEQLYFREKQRKVNERKLALIRNKCSPQKMVKANGHAKCKSPTYKVNITQKRRIKQFSPKKYKSRLYFKNGKIGCIEAENAVSNLRSTHEIVKNIINNEENMLVSLETQLKAQSQVDESPEKSLATPIDSPKMNVSDIAKAFCNDPLNVENQIIHKNNLQKTETFEIDEHIDDIDMAQEPENVDFVSVRLRHLANRFSERTRKMRSKLEIPPTPSSSASVPSMAPSSKHNTELRAIQNSALTLRSFTEPVSCNHYFCPIFCGGGRQDSVLDPQGRLYISWLFVVSLSFLYNAWVIPLRSSFPYQTKSNQHIWIAVDLFADLIYLLDILFFKHRVMYLFEGFWVKDKSLTRKNYMRKLKFKMDLLALMPLDLLYFKYGAEHVVLRAPRLLKIQSFWEFFKLIDRVLSSPHVIRVVKTLTYMLYMIHLTACSYYAYSSYQGLGTNRWVFNNTGNAYVRCFAFATKTATSIGKNPKPDQEGELLFMTAAWLMGVFVFALLIGQIRDIIATATRLKSEYKQLVDETLEYMRRLNLPTDLQRRVKMWFTFTWEQQRSLDETHILDALPANLKTDIAISVHIQTLSKVQIFADCEDALLRELVLKLRSVTFLPGDYVCRKGEVGKEMYIVKTGQVQVMGGMNNDTVLATLSEGSVFGEISLLAINGTEGNRRTADVKSKGFSNLFVLSKSDLNEALVYYPSAQAILKKRAKSLMRKNAAREKAESEGSLYVDEDDTDVVIENPNYQKTPKLLRTVISALPLESPAVQLLTYGFKRESIRSKSANELDTKIAHIDIENEKQVEFPPDLMTSIRNELMECNNYINMTDSEKQKLCDELESSPV